MLKKIEIQWNDTFNNGGWWKKEDITDGMKGIQYLNTSIGYLVEKDEMWVVIATSYCKKQESWGDINHIPKGCIISMRYLR